MENQQINEAKQKQQALREQVVGAGWLTRDQIFKDALTKFSEDPNSFDASQLTNLYNVGKQLGYYNDTMLDVPAEEQAAKQEAQKQAEQKAANNNNNEVTVDVQRKTNVTPIQWGKNSIMWSL